MRCDEVSTIDSHLKSEDGFSCQRWDEGQQWLMIEATPGLPKTSPTHQLIKSEKAAI
jgi:hypothetical protein